VHRGRLLHLAISGLGLTALDAVESVRQLLDHALAEHQRGVEEWMLTCADHLHAIRTRPPARRNQPNNAHLCQRLDRLIGRNQPTHLT
jgi:hypothetical protein